MANKLHSLGAPRAGFVWGANAREVDMATSPAKPAPLRIAAAPQNITIDLKRSAMVVIDMQNDFCAKGGWVDALGIDYTPDRKPIKPLQKLLPAAAQGGRAGDLGQLGQPARPRQHAAQPDPSLQARRHGRRPGRSGARQRRAGRCRRTPGQAAVVDELVQKPEDIKVDKHRICGFWDTPLDSILRNLGTRTVLFSGVNTDQCVLHSLTDANFLGYGCVLVEDCCGTTSPDFCTEASVWNVKKCFGFVTDSGKILKALKK